MTSTTMDIYAESSIPWIQKERLKFNSKEPFVPTFITSSVSQSSHPKEIYASRVHGKKILLENPLGVGKREKKEKEKDKKPKGGKRQFPTGRINGSWRLDPRQAKFHLFVPLHHLWMSYMSELMALKPTEVPSSSLMHPKLLKADFSGSWICVDKSKNPSLIGLQGIVIHESENTVVIVTKENKSKVIPKQNSIFKLSVPAYPPTELLPSPLSIVLDIPHLDFVLYANQFRFRSSERAGRKFKHKESIEL